VQLNGRDLTDEINTSSAKFVGLCNYNYRGPPTSLSLYSKGKS